VKKAEVVYYKLLGFKEREISERLGIFQSSVNTRSTNAQWGLLNTAIKDFENLKIDSICG
jgi:DNA-directed RNA polymerase specialized sigma24 family protein